MDIATQMEEPLVPPVFGDFQPPQDRLLPHAMTCALLTKDARDSFSVEQEQARIDAI